jgi:crotonobetainyl-CoA:carnitine CoA-transferase CaiB-like acyl-CoA transferase
VRIIEVAEFAFVPASSALLSDWGAEVIKIEPVDRGDAGRGISDIGPSGVQVRFHNTNRGKKSLGLDLAKPEGREILYRLVKTADIFLTNKQPRVRRKLQIDVEHIRAHNPNIIYVRGSGQGARGPEAERGSYDLLNFWHRAGPSSAVVSPEGAIPFLPAPGFGDLIGAMFIAGGMMGALYHRERTGEASIVDASLLATGMWAMAGSGATAASDGIYEWPPKIRNPLSAIYRTKDGRHVALSCLQAGRYWRPLCEVLGRPDMAEDPRFQDHTSIMANFEVAEKLLVEAFSQRPLDEWRARLDAFSGQWAVVQNVLQVVNDPQALANGYVQNVRTADGKPFKLVAAPIQFDGEAAAPRPGPDFNQHGDEILAGIGLDQEAIIDLKIKGVVA